MLITLPDTMSTKHSVHQMLDTPSVFNKDHKVIWKPTCYLTPDGKLYAYIYIRKEPPDEWFVTCHTYADEETLEHMNVKCSLQSAPVPHGYSTGSDMPDYLAPQELRPTVTNLHQNAIRITCPRAATLNFIIHGREEGATEKDPHLGYCMVSVTSQKAKDPINTVEGETSFQYKGKLVPASMQFEDIKESGRYLRLKDSQVHQLKKGSTLFYLAVEFGAVIRLRYQRPSMRNSLAKTGEKPDGEEPARKRTGDPRTEPGGEEPVAKKQRTNEAQDEKQQPASEDSQDKNKDTPIPDNSIVVSKILIPFKVTSKANQRKRDSSTEQAKAQTMPMTSVVPILPAADFPQQDIYTTIRRSHKVLHGNFTH